MIDHACLRVSPIIFLSVSQLGEELKNFLITELLNLWEAQVSYHK